MVFSIVVFTSLSAAGVDSGALTASSSAAKSADWGTAETNAAVVSAIRRVFIGRKQKHAKGLLHSGILVSGFFSPGTGWARWTQCTQCTPWTPGETPAPLVPQDGPAAP